MKTTLIHQREAMAWKKLKLLGAGSYGSVYLAAAVNKPYYSPVAVKSAVIDFSSSESKAHLVQLSSLRKEADLLQELRGYEHVVQGFGVDVSSEYGRNFYNLVMEYAPGGTLNNMIRAFNGSMTEFQIAIYTYMLLKGLSNIHGKDIVHCDFKPANILLFPPQDIGGISVLKITDFGSSRKVSEPDLWGRSRCTAPYASPESVLWGMNEKAGDVWALGCIVAEMITGRPLWTWTGNESDIFRQIVQERPKIPENISEDGKDFLRRCLDREFHKRWSADMLLDHPFIVKNVCLSNAAATHQQRPWFCSKGMFSTPLEVQPFPKQPICAYKPYQLFPERGCGLPFAVPLFAGFGTIC